MASYSIILKKDGRTATKSNVQVDYQLMHDDLTGSPGPKDLIAGDMSAGFFGEVSVDKLWDGVGLAGEVGITQGVSQHRNEPWLKIATHERIIFVSKKSYRSNISWNHINSKGAIFGEVSVGKNGIKYKVRVLEGANKNPFNENEGADLHYSEWNRLIIPISKAAKDGDWVKPENVENDYEYWGVDYNLSDLGLTSDSGNGYHPWCQEKATNGDYLGKGRDGVETNVLRSGGTDGPGVGWRPVLEVIEE